MYRHEVHLSNGQKKIVGHPNPNPSQKDIVDSLIRIGEGAVAGLIVKIVTRGRK